MSYDSGSRFSSKSAPQNNYEFTSNNNASNSFDPPPYQELPQESYQESMPNEGTTKALPFSAQISPFAEAINTQS